MGEETHTFNKYVYEKNIHIYLTHQIKYRLNRKMHKILEETQRRYPNGQQTCEIMFNIVGQEGNENWNHNVIPLHTQQND